MNGSTTFVDNNNTATSNIRYWADIQTIDYPAVPSLVSTPTQTQNITVVSTEI